MNPINKDASIYENVTPERLKELGIKGKIRSADSHFFNRVLPLSFRKYKQIHHDWENGAFCFVLFFDEHRKITMEETIIKVKNRNPTFLIPVHTKECEDTRVCEECAVAMKTENLLYRKKG